jgi:four helix bundle protein
MQNYEDLSVWRKADAIVLEVYAVTRKFPREELYGITSQLRRASVSVPTNIVEGSRRKTRQDFARFLNISESSAAEVEYLLGLAQRLGYASPEDIQPLRKSVDEIKRMIYSLRLKVEAGQTPWLKLLSTES